MGNVTSMMDRQRRAPAPAPRASVTLGGDHPLFGDELELIIASLGHLAGSAEITPADRLAAAMLADRLSNGVDAGV